MSRSVRRDLLIAAITFIATPTVAHAYVDPGSAGFIITTVLGFLAAGGYIVRGYLGRLKRWVFRGDRKAENSNVSDATDGRTDDRKAQD